MLSGTRRSGKTSLALSMGLHVAANAHRHVLYVTTQETTVSLTQRLIGWEGDVDVLQIDRGRLRRTDWSVVGRAVESLSEVPLNFFAHPFPSLDQITLAVARVELKGTLDMVIVDCLQDLRGWSKAHSGERRGLVNGLVSLARTSCVPVIAIAPLRRSAEQKPPPFEIDDLRSAAAMKQVRRFLFTGPTFVATRRRQPSDLTTPKLMGVAQPNPSVSATGGMQVIL